MGRENTLTYLGVEISADGKNINTMAQIKILWHQYKYHGTNINTMVPILLPWQQYIPWHQYKYYGTNMNTMAPILIPRH